MNPPRTPMKAPPPPSRPPEPAVRFRSEIEAAAAAGLPLDDMTLRLTHADLSKLKRDANLAVTDISFSDGAMRFLGVKVEGGGVPKSILQHGALTET